MLNLTPAKREALERLSDENGIIGALAIDQRGSLKKMLQKESTTNQGDDTIVSFKELISEELTPYATSILLDPEYGLPAAQKRDKNAGLLLAYEKTGYDATQPGRMPDILEDWSVQRIKAQGADAVKFLLYYDVDEDSSINEKKHIFVERLGSECQAEDILFFLELVSYDADNDDVKGSEYAKVKPHKVNDMMIEFSKPQYKVDVLKVEVPVNMQYVEGFSEETPVYSHEEAQRYFKEQSEATDLPFIFLSAGVSASLFQETLRFAKEAGSSFNGVLCGRATWKDSVSIFGRDGEAAGKQWLQQQGRTNVEELNEVLKQTATSWKQAEILA
ncbi:tagatose-bisphosphate aldolase [Terribacillus saccharophilus]|uniref:tagatose-bisphosphate aldolase n=1 Tax=Terribacillus saccharophilus TaxID=361277 RepID=UPI002989FCE1|nr:tagatose-bisphosphate aldolase [Terribacillus saccharophilus]MCM3225660.1 tagatose-bisphosphate aldolase [Terribacillus saccharophilus]